MSAVGLRPRVHTRVRRRQLALASVAVAVPLWAACGGGGSAAAAKAPTALCQKLLAVFSDGPDPDADPVGYALSQELPLSQIHSSDTAAIQTVKSLIAADRVYVKSNGADHSAKKTIASDDGTLNKACPGVAS
jgi:hypothetical protein